MALVELSKIVKRFGDTEVVKSLDLLVEKGEFLTFLGPSGCGKTTTLRMIGGFEQPTSGTILLAGKDVVDLPPYKRDVNTVFQSYALFPHMTVAENVAYGLEQKRVPKPERATRVKDALAMVRMDAFAKRRPRELSGGQQQRVAVARAIVNSPAVLLLDEPLGALDLKLRKEMQVELKQLHRRLGMTFIYVTHDQEEALTMSDRIAVMNGGRIEQIDTPVEIYCRPRTRFVADFIGETNLLTGTVAAGGEAMTVGGQRLPILKADNLPEGQEAHLSIRPEMVTVRIPKDGEPAAAGAHRAGPPPTASLPGTVEETIFVGSVWKTIVKTAGGARVTASEPPGSHGYIAPGTEVSVEWAVGSAVVLPE
jgi:spermidine/putrescine transport system ATP-binding protein